MPARIDPSQEESATAILTVALARFNAHDNLNCHVASVRWEIAKSIEIANPDRLTRCRKGSTPWKHGSGVKPASQPRRAERPAEVGAHLIASQLGSTWRHTPPTIRWTLRWRGCCRSRYPVKAPPTGPLVSRAPRDKIDGVSVRP